MPAKAPAKTTRRDQTRSAILAAAGNIFATSGLAGARTEAIARAAGVNKAMLYYYFHSKEALYEAVLEEHFRDFNQQALDILRQNKSAAAVLLQYVDLQFDFISKHHRYAPLFQQLMTNGGKSLARLVKKHFAPRAAALQQLLVRGSRTGEFRPCSPLHASVSITALIVFYFSAANVLQLLGDFDPYSPASLRRRKAEVFDFIRHALFHQPEHPLP